MSQRAMKYLNDNRIIYRKYSTDKPTKTYNWGWYYADGTHGYYSLFNTKAKNVHKLSKILLTLHDGAVPADRAALEALPGVGRKTANVVLNEAFGQSTIAVDTHIFRLSNRTKMAPGKTPDIVEAELVRRVPDKWRKGAHHWLILHGRYVCKARKPNCAACVITDLCLSRDKTG